MKRKKSPAEYMLFVVTILFISFMVNVFISLDNEKYKYKVSTASYKNIEEIRSRNEKNIVTLEGAINSSILTNQELLALYKNYTSISSSMISLWDEYSFYTDNEWSLTKKKIDTTKALSNEISGRIEEYLGILLDEEMKTQTPVIQLKGETLDKFKTMQSLAIDIESYYEDFYKENIKDKVDEEKEKIIIKNAYWIDILEGLNNLSEKYADYNFTIK